MEETHETPYNSIPASAAHILLKELLTQAQFSNQRTIALYVIIGDVGQQIPPLADQAQQPAPARMILGMLAQMFVQLINPLGKNSHLHFHRAGVFIRTAMFFNKRLFFFFFQRH